MLFIFDDFWKVGHFQNLTFPRSEAQIKTRPDQKSRLSPQNTTPKPHAIIPKNQGEDRFRNPKNIHPRELNAFKVCARTAITLTFRTSKFDNSGQEQYFPTRQKAYPAADNRLCQKQQKTRPQPPPVIKKDFRSITVSA